MTPSVNEGTQTFPQDMVGGQLEAVVKFHRNKEYLTDLSGEYGSPGRSMSTDRVPIEEIITSTATKDANGNVLSTVSLSGDPAAMPELFEFQLSTPIPINATDILLQIVYRGPLGSEGDAVVVATRDITEPHYLVIQNTTDYMFCVNGTWYLNNPDGSVSAEARAEIIRLGGDPDGYWYGPDPLPEVAVSLGSLFDPYAAPLFSKLNLMPREFIRVALLTEPEAGSPPTYSYAWGVDGVTSNRVTTPVARNQIYFQDNGTLGVYHVMQKFRGVFASNHNLVYKRYGANCNDPSFDDSNPTIPTLVAVDTLSGQ